MMIFRRGLRIISKTDFAFAGSLPLKLRLLALDLLLSQVKQPVEMDDTGKCNGMVPAGGTGQAKSIHLENSMQVQQ